MKHCHFIFLYILNFSYPTLALNCEWWQSKVKANDVDKHERSGYDVKAYHRDEHCREKWPGGDKYAPSLQNKKPLDWSQKEIFVYWNDQVAQKLILILNEMPTWIDLRPFKYHRAVKSIFPGNPTSSNQNNIAFYDLFFKLKNRKEIVAHELAHFYYKSLGLNALEDFAILSGWTYKIVKNKVYESPPKNLIQADSSVDKEEDFANYFGLFIDKPDFVKKYNIKAYDFLNKRYNK